MAFVEKDIERGRTNDWGSFFPARKNRDPGLPGLLLMESINGNSKFLHLQVPWAWGNRLSRRSGNR